MLINPILINCVIPVSAPKNPETDLVTQIVSSLQAGKSFTADNGSITVINSDQVDQFISNPEYKQYIYSRLAAPDCHGVTVQAFKKADGELEIISDPKKYKELIASGKYSPLALIIIQKNCTTSSICELPLEIAVRHELVHARQNHLFKLKLIEEIESAVGTEKEKMADFEENLYSLVFELKPMLETEYPYYLSQKNYRAAAKILFGANALFAFWNELAQKAASKKLTRILDSLIKTDKIDIHEYNKMGEKFVPGIFLMDPAITYRQMEVRIKNNCLLFAEWLPDLNINTEECSRGQKK